MEPRTSCGTGQFVLFRQGKPVIRFGMSRDKLTRSASFEVAPFGHFPEGVLEISPGQASECERRPGK